MQILGPGCIQGGDPGVGREVAWTTKLPSFLLELQSLCSRNVDWQLSHIPDLGSRQLWSNEWAL